MTSEERILGLLKQNQDILLKTYKSAEKTRKYILYNAIFTVLIFILPLIGLAIAIPMFMKTYMSSLEGLI